MKKKKLFIYIHQSILKGGVEKVFCNLLNNLPREKYDITVLSHMAYLTDDIHAGLYPENVKRRWLYYDEFAPGGLKRLCQRIHNFLMPPLYPKVLKLRKFDTAIATQEGFYATFVQEHVRAEKKLLWIHNDMGICHWTGKYFESNQAEGDCYRKFDKVVCVSGTVADSMRALFGPMDNLCVCYNPIDTAQIDEKAREAAPQRGARPLFVAVGRLANQKGFDRLIRICERLNRDGYGYDVWILGEGEDREALTAQLETAGVDNIRLLGNQPNPFPYMKTADWLICTSRHEGFNTALQEAVWCGVPILTMETSGVRELLGDSEYGIVTENDEDDFYRAMVRVLEDPALLARYREAVERRKAFIDLSGRIAAIEKIL